MKSEKKAQMQKYVLTCPLKCCGTKVKYTYGDITGAENILNDGCLPAKLISQKTGDKPFFIMDMGKSTPGGYPVFKIKSQTGNPVLRISYSDWYDHLLHPVHGENGDYNRGTATYLGVELPAAPANPYRYELYTISAPGIYASPMIQGQQRAVRFQLDTAGEIEMEWYYIENVSDRSEYEGYFDCSDKNLTGLWYSSAYTCQIASFANSNMWEVVKGNQKLAARGLSKANGVGLIADAGLYKLSNYSFEFTASITKNPGPVSSLGWVVRALNKDNCIIFRLDLDGKFYAKRRVDGVYKNIKDAKALDSGVLDNREYHIKTVVSGDVFTTYLDGSLIDVTTDGTYEYGSCGFCQGLDQWAFFGEAILRSPGGEMLFYDNFKSGLDKWDFGRTLSFVADGAKRDRLPWIGDLDWAGRNLYYTFKGYSYMRDSLLMFAFNTTPEGYVWATCYPENKEPPKIGDYGYYQSDIFSAWFVPTLADYLLYTGDLETCASMYGVMKADLDYLWDYTEADGLHFQRYDTSKGLWDHVLGQTIGKYTYNNILIWDALTDGAFIAENLGFHSDAQIFKKRAEVMREGINKYLWHSDGYFTTHKGSDAYCFMSNALAMAVKFVDNGAAEKIRDRFMAEEFFHGKIVSLVIRGFYEYGFDREAIGRLYEPKNRIDWFSPLDDDRGPCTTWECMIYPVGQANGANWGDLSHPDTAMAHIMSGYMLGIQPLKAGFSEYKVKPMTAGMDYAEGCVPTIYGDIEFEWKKTSDSFAASLISPYGTTAQIYLPKIGGGEIHINGKPACECGLKTENDGDYIVINNAGGGNYEFEVK
ncbi:MAG: hypothetical protein FWD23_01690 [Oscillospiraceae bacterium]|nr:hypothetical protein [Oscillospiraceae bacterium]